MKKTKMLKKNYEFKQVLSKGKYYTGNYVEAFIKTNNQNINLLGIAISVKVGKAVKRNQIKRHIRENYRMQENKIKTGYSIVFLWKKKQNVENATHENIKKDIEKIIERADLQEENQ